MLHANADAILHAPGNRRSGAVHWYRETQCRSMIDVEFDDRHRVDEDVRSS